MRLSISWLRRQAKTVKKELSVSHTKALDIVAREQGFKGWSDLLQSAQEVNEHLDDIEEDYME